MSLRSPIVAGVQFALPYVDVVTPMKPVDADTSSADTESNSDAELSSDLMQQISRPMLGPVAFIGRFINLGVPRERTGSRHTLYFSRKPMGNLFAISDDTFKVSGYLSYNYLLSGSVVVGLVFSTDHIRTRSTDHKLIVRSSNEPHNFTVNFNLEKMGLLMFVAEDSSTIVIPNDIESSLIVRTD